MGRRPGGPRRAVRRRSLAHGVVEYVQIEGGLSSTKSGLFLATVGLASIAGSISADAINRLGGRRSYVLAAATEAASLLLLARAPSALEAVFISAVLFGFAYNAIVAVAVIWSSRVFAARPSAGLAAVMVMQAVGLLAGPPMLGLIADQAGLSAIFTVAAALMLATTALAPGEELRDGCP